MYLNPFLSAVFCLKQKSPKKMLLVMKLTAILLIAVCLQANAHVFSQKITLKEQNVSLEKVFREIRKQTNYQFFYPDEIVRKAKKVTIDIRNGTLKQVLDVCFSGQLLAYTVSDNIIIIKRRPEETENRPNLVAPVPAEIKGRVTNEQGQPLAGATVAVRASDMATQTDADGNFSLPAPAGSVLVISFVGYQTREITVTEQSTLVISLKPAYSTGEQVVVVGYGTQKKRNISTAISSVTSGAIEKLSITRVEQALQGNAPGVMVLNQNGQPGSKPMIRVRGTGTNTDPNPLYIVDGFPVSNIEYINTGDIERIDVLKDAASAAIYGARGANGVILITTKSGKAGKVTFNYDGYYGIQNVWRKVPQLNAAQYATMMNEGSKNANPANPLPYPDPASLGEGTNWQNAIFQKNVPVTSHQITASGGTDKTTYLTSFSYLDQQGVIGEKKSEFKRYTFRLNLNQKVMDFFRIGTNLNYIHTRQAAIFDNGDQGGQALGNAFNIDPITPVYETDPAKLAAYNPNAVKNGSLTYGISPLATFPNPLAQLAIINGDNKVDKLIGNVFGEVDIVKGLKFRSSFSTDLQYNTSNGMTPIYFLTATSGQTYTSVSKNFSRAYSWQAENVLSYSFQVNRHSVELLAGQSGYKYFYENLSGNRTDPSPIDPAVAYLDVASTTPATGANAGGADARTLASFFGRMSYDYGGKYLLSGVIRRDGSSRFGRNNPYATFPSVSGSWVISSEDFYHSSLFSFLKLRASWGQNGNESLGSSFPWASTIVTYGNQYTFLDNNGVEYLENGASLGAISNPNLRWETSEQTNIGADAELLNGRIGLTADYYVKTTRDLLVRPSIPDIVGYGAPYVNGGNVRNSGVELGLTFKDKIGRDLGINAAFNISHNVNKVTRINNASQTISGANYINLGSITRMAVGQPIGYFWGVQTNGIFQTTEQVDAYTWTNPDTHAENKIQPNAKPGDLIFVDANDDGKINDNDRVYLGDPNPKYTTGLTINLTYRDFDLNVFAIGMFGQKVFNGNYRFDKTVSNMPATMLDHWTPDNTDARYPRFISNDPNKNYSTVSDLLLENGSFVRVKNLQLGYTLPNVLTRKALINGFRIYVAVDNAFTFTKYKGFDPEIGATSPLSMGIDRGVYPQSITYRFGVNIKL